MARIMLIAKMKGGGVASAFIDANVIWNRHHHTDRELFHDELPVEIDVIQIANSDGAFRWDKPALNEEEQ